MSTMPCTITRGEDDEEIHVTVSYTFHRACLGSTDGRFGPKLEPDEPAHFEIDSVTRDDNGESFDTTEAEDADIQDALADDKEPDPDRYRD